MCHACRHDLHGSIHLWRKRGHADLLAMRALFLLADVLPHNDARQGNIHDLPTLTGAPHHLMQVGLTMLAALHPLHDHLIGRGRKAQTLTRMARLSTWLFAALLPQTLGLAYKPIRGRRQMAVVAIFAQLLFQCLHTLQQLSNQFVPVRKLFFQCLILFSKWDQFFFWLHTCYFTRSSALLQAGRRPEQLRFFLDMRHLS